MYIEKHLMGRPDHTSYWPSWMLNITDSDRNFNLVSGYMLRPKEELFEPGKDKYERNNLAGKFEYSEIQKHLADFNVIGEDISATKGVCNIYNEKINTFI